MQTHINYSRIVIVSFAIAYFIIGALNLFGIVSSKVVLFCSVTSLIVAISQILDSIAIYMEMMERNLLKNSLRILIQVHEQDVLNNSATTQDKIREFRADKDKIHEQYAQKINSIVKWSNNMLAIALVVFIVGMAINSEIECGVISDTASLISFSLIFLGISVNDYLNNKIKSFDFIIRHELDKMGVDYSE